MSQKFSIEHDTEWQRPDQAWFDYQEASKGIDPDQLEWNGKYKTLREKRDIAVFGASIYKLTGQPNFTGYVSFLNIIASEIIINILGLVAIVMHFLFPTKEGKK